jgi:hypothetical protein
MLLAIWPTSSFSAHIAGNPDFYGPFWIPTTVIFCLFATSTMAESISKKWSGQEFTSFDITLLSYAAATVYSYVIALPSLIFFTSKYFKNEQVKLFELISVYGYGMTVWIPASILCVIPSEILRWVIAILSFLLGGIFLFT